MFCRIVWLILNTHSQDARTQKVFMGTTGATGATATIVVLGKQKNHKKTYKIAVN